MINGIGIAIFNVPPLIMTLGMASVINGMVIIYSQGFIFKGSASELLKTVGGGQTIPGFPNMIIVWGVIILISLFIRTTRRARNPAIDLSMFDDRNYRYANLAMLVFGFAFAAMFLSFVLFLTGVWGYSILQAGLAITPGPVVVAAVAPFAGRLAGHRGHRVILLPGAVLYAISSLWLLTATATPDLTGVWLPSVIVGGLGVGILLPGLTGSAVQGLPEILFGVGSAINQAVRQIGGVFGVAAVVALLWLLDRSRLGRTFRAVGQDEHAAAAEIASRLNLPVYGVRVLLDMGLSIGLVWQRDGRYVLDKIGTEVARAAGFNPAPAVYNDTEAGGHTEEEAEQIDGIMTPDCTGFTIDVASATAEGNPLVLKLWLV